MLLFFFAKPKYKETENKHKYAICIAARNEEKVIRNLLESIDNQDYPKDKLQVFVVADNVLAPDYITRMNEAFDAGNEVVTSFRNSKNITQNWIAFSYAMHWMRTCLFEHRGKVVFRLSCRIQGTGFVFANHFVENGQTMLHYLKKSSGNLFHTTMLLM